MSDITLTQTQRNTLSSLSEVSVLFNRTQGRLNSGKKVNTVQDDAVAYFRAQSLTNRAAEIVNQNAVTDQSIQSLNTALSATSAVEGLLQQLKGVLEGARGTTLNTRVSATQQFKDIGQQLAQLTKDASYQGLDLLTSTSASLTTQFSERTAATFTIQGYDLAATSGTGGSRTIFTAAITAFNSDGSINFSSIVASGNNTVGSFQGFSSLDVQASPGSVISSSQASAYFAVSDIRLDSAISQVNAISAALGVNVAILQARANFSSNYAGVLSNGSDALTLADLNTEAANSSALQLRQQLGIQSLSASNTQNASILTLLR